MTRIRLFFFLLSCFFIAISAHGQKQKPIRKNTPAPSKNQSSIPAKVVPDPTKDEEQVKGIIQVLGFMLNTLGSSTTSTRDKDVIIKESYSKIFRDSKVQIEDDLDDERSVVTNKDVDDYLKDINFFFGDVTFELVIDHVDLGENEDHQPFYKVSLHRNLVGTTKDGKKVSNNMVRFVELNYNKQKQDLKIVSIYTNVLDENAALVDWWKQLSYEWHSIFQKRCNLTDSVTLSDIRRVTSIDLLDLRDNPFIQSFEPLAKLKNLKSLNLSFTRMTDLSPIRNLTGLVELDISHTAIRDLLPLKYSSSLTRLNLSHTEVTDIQIFQRMPQIAFLDLSATDIMDFGPLAYLTELKTVNLSDTKFSDPGFLKNAVHLSELNISRTLVQDITSLQGLTDLTSLAIDSTRIHSINGLANSRGLRVLHADYTLISDLTPLQKLPVLEKVYCDKTLTKRETAEAFMLGHPNVSVVYDSHDLRNWWNHLTDPWKEVISGASGIGVDPSSEELSRVGNIDSINLGGRTISDLEPLLKLEKLKVIIASKTSIQNLSAIEGHREVKFIDISETNVTDLSPLSRMTKLQIVMADHCKGLSVNGVQKIAGLKRLYVDGTGVNDINALEFMMENRSCIVIFKTPQLNHWWTNLSPEWKNVFLSQLKDTTREGLHDLVERESFSFKEFPVPDLSGLSEFIRLKELHFAGTGITSVGPIQNLNHLKSLHATNSPIQNIESISQLTELEDLDISNTPVVDLFPVIHLKKLKKINCAGTQIKRLDGVEKLEGLEELDCSNTNVSRLASLDYLHLKSFKCYNTKISKNTIDHFMGSHPECKVVYYR